MGGDHRTMNMDNPGRGTMKAVQELVQYHDDDDEHSFTYWNLENNVITHKNYKGKVLVLRDPVNAEKSLVEYKSTWESGEFDEQQVNMMLTSLESFFELKRMVDNGAPLLPARKCRVRAHRSRQSRRCAWALSACSIQIHRGVAASVRNGRTRRTWYVADVCH